MFPNLRRIIAIALTMVVVASNLMSASAQSTGKNLSSNFTLVNLEDGQNTGEIRYVLPDGGQWRAPTADDSFTLDGLGDQLERRQYFDAQLPAGSGSVVVSTDGPVGAVVQIQARPPQVSTFGAYIGVSVGASEASMPLVMRRRGTASGEANSQLIIQNASSSTINVQVTFFDGVTGNAIPAATKSIPNLAPNAAFEYDLETENNLPENWYGSAVISSQTAGGEVAVVSNLFNGEHTVQTFNAFTAFQTTWGVPLLTSRLANGASSPLVIQNRSGSTIPVDAIVLSCVQGNGSPAPATFELRNKTAIPDGAAFFDFNPVTNTDFPEAWFGSCTVSTGTFNTALFIQMRVVGKEADGNFRAGAFEGIPLSGSDTRVVIPLYARRLANGFASNATIQNLSTSQEAQVTLVYKGADGLPAACSTNFNRSIPAGGSLLQNHRIPNGVDNAVPEVAENCYGTLTVTSNNSVPIDGFVQLDQLDDISPPTDGQPSGDRFMAHNVFTLE